jgi:uncharacterized protein YqeY
MLYDKIIDDLKTAMLTKNNISRDCLKLIIAEIKNKNVLEGKDITDDLCLAIIKKSVKQHSDSIEQFTKANRNDLVEKERTEKRVVNREIMSFSDEDDEDFEE